MRIVKGVKRLQDLPGFPEESWICVKEAEIQYNLNYNTIWSWIKHGRIEAYKYYKMVFIPEKDIPTFMRS